METLTRNGRGPPTDSSSSTAAVIRAFLPSLPIIIEHPQPNFDNCQLQPLQAKIIRHFPLEKDSIEMMAKYPVFPSSCLRPLKYLSEGVFHRVYLAEYRPLTPPTPPSLASSDRRLVPTKVAVKDF